MPQSVDNETRYPLWLTLCRCFFVSCGEPSLPNCPCWLFVATVSPSSAYLRLFFVQTRPASRLPPCRCVAHAPARFLVPPNREVFLDMFIWTTLPSRTTTRGVPVSRAICRARNAARRMAAMEPSTMGLFADMGVLICFLQFPAILGLLHRYRTTSNRSQSIYKWRENFSVPSQNADE